MYWCCLVWFDHHPFTCVWPALVITYAHSNSHRQHLCIQILNICLTNEVFFGQALSYLTLFDNQGFTVFLSAMTKTLHVFIMLPLITLCQHVIARCNSYKWQVECLAMSWYGRQSWKVCSACCHLTRLLQVLLTLFIMCALWPADPCSVDFPDIYRASVDRQTPLF